jgi:hypothetical protein
MPIKSSTDSTARAKNLGEFKAFYTYINDKTNKTYIDA